MLKPNNFNPCGIGHIKRCNDGGQALQVIGIVGNDQRVVARVGINGVVRADQGAQHRHQVVSRLVVQPKNLRENLAA